MSTEAKTAVLLFLLALALRLVAPSASPPGFNDDELSNALVVNQLVRDGDIRVYYPHASGHEGLYHILAAPLLPLFGPGHIGIRGVSILLGALSVALLYLLVAHLWDRPTAIIAALGLAFSFWSLIYSRVGQRHISLPAFALLAFYCWWRGMAPSPPAPPPQGGRGVRGDREVQRIASPVPPPPSWGRAIVQLCWGLGGESNRGSTRRALLWFAGSGVALGLGFYTYFAARGVPLILIAFAGYLLLFHRDTLRLARCWRGMALALLIAAIMAVPLIVTLQQNPTAEARVEELAAPINKLREGDPSTLIDYTLTTLGMFAFTGDDEALYNIPDRPVFGPVGAAFFFAGLAVAVWRWRQPRYAFLLLWTAAGIAPGAMAVPAASLGHTILAQPAAYIFPAVGVCALARSAGWRAGRPVSPRRAVEALLMLALIYTSAEVVRGVVDYFVVRPRDGYVRVLFHTDFIELARYLNGHEEITDIVIGAQINERWNQAAFDTALERDDVRARWHDPRKAMVQIPAGGYVALPHYFFDEFRQSVLYEGVVAETDDFLIARQVEAGPTAEDGMTPFTLGLTHMYSLVDSRTYRFETRWRVEAPLDLPPRPLYSKPPAPGEPDKPRLEVFLHVLPRDGDVPAFATGGLGVDPYTLHPSDWFSLPLDVTLDELDPGTYRVGVGLFDPWTGERYLTEDGRDMVIVGELEVPG